MSSTSRVVLSPTHSELEHELLTKIEALLTDQLSPDDAAAWAIDKLYVEKAAPRGRTLVGSGLNYLLMNKFSPDGMKDALRDMRAALQGKKKHVTSVTEFSREDIEHRWPGALMSEEELARLWPQYATYQEPNL